MIVFKNYFKILKKYKFIILMYTIILLVFTFTNTKNSSPISSFTASKPDIAIINLDKDSKIVDNFYKYIEKNAILREIENDDEKIADSLFYEDIKSVIYIYDGYTEDYLNNNEKPLDIKNGIGSYSSYANMLIEKYFKIADIANDELDNEDEIIELINDTLSKESKIEVQSTLDTGGLSTMGFFFDFSNYSILSICIYVVSIVILRFNNEKVKKRNIISSKSVESINKELYLGNLVFVLIVWIALIAFSFVLGGNIMCSMNGLLFSINSLVFMFCALSVGLLVGNLLKSENTVTALINIIGLGTSFMCGSFIPVEYLPETVIKCSKVLPSYWFIHNNELIKTMEVFNWETISPLIVNMAIVLGFSAVYIVITNVISKRIRR